MNSNLRIKNVNEKQIQTRSDKEIYKHRNLLNSNISNDKFKFINTTVNNSYNNKYLFDNLMENNKKLISGNVNQHNLLSYNNNQVQYDYELSNNTNHMSCNNNSIVISGVSYALSNRDLKNLSGNNIENHNIHNMYKYSQTNFDDDRNISNKQISNENHIRILNNEISNNNMLASRSTNAGSESEDFNMKKPPKYIKEIGEDYYYYSTHVIGKGSFGKVVYGRNKKDEDLCFKVEKISNQKNGSILRDEYRIYEYLKDSVGIPQIYTFGEYKKNRFLAMELIGPSLDKLFLLCNKKFSLETTIYLGLEMIERIEFVHSRGIIHRDIKPNNFLFGKYSRKIENWDNTLYIIDFGLSTSYLDIPINNSSSNNTQKEVNSFEKSETNKSNVITKYTKCKAPDQIMTTQNNQQYMANFPNKIILKDKMTNVDYSHINYKDNCRFVGTPRYASLNTHVGIRQSRRDDLESIAYILIYFYIGDLPWQGVRAKTKSEKKEKIKQIKNDLDIFNEAMFNEKNLPIELKELLFMCRNTKFDEIPDYNAMKNILIKLREKMKYPTKPVYFDWEEYFINNRDREESKKEYKKLYHGYPTINLHEYISYLKAKKSNSKDNSNENEALNLSLDINWSNCSNYTNNNNKSNNSIPINSYSNNIISNESCKNNINKKQSNTSEITVKKQQSNFSLLTINGKTVDENDQDQYENLNIEKISNQFMHPNTLLSKKKSDFYTNPPRTHIDDANLEDIETISLGLNENEDNNKNKNSLIKSNLIQEMNLNSINQNIDLNKDRKYKKVVKTTSNTSNTENPLKFSINKDTGEITDDDEYNKKIVRIETYNDINKKNIDHFKIKIKKS